jgi:general secretion pathway protein A
MEPYQYFGLAASPFDGRPDPRFFYESPSHTETLATLRYAAHTGKTCSLVLGDSGSGKTLIGRLLAQRVARRMGVLWVYGIGQPGGQTEVTIYPPGSLETPDAMCRQSVEESSLANWIRSGLPLAPATLVVFDNADGLPTHSWEDILSLVTREVRTPRPVSIVLLGLPGLADRLAAPELVRLRRRVFRTCQLQRLTRDTVEHYVRHRLKVAGGNGHEIFTAPALDLIHRFSGGNPALINQICDNALVDAFADERKQIDAPHVMVSVQAITGGLPKARALPRPATSLGLGPLPVLEVPEAYRLGTGPGGAGVPDGVAPAESLTASGFVGYPAENAHDLRGAAAAQMGASSHAAQAVGRVVTRPVQEVAGPPTTSYVPLDQRLQALESRLSDALSRVREARSRRSLGPVAEGGASDPPDSSDAPEGDGAAAPVNTAAGQVVDSGSDQPAPA